MTTRAQNDPQTAARRHEITPDTPLPLDVERLARALTTVQGGAYASWLGRAPLIAREYAALARETPR